MIVSRHLRKSNARLALSKARLLSWRGERLGLPPQILAVRRRFLYWSVEG